MKTAATPPILVVEDSDEDFEVFSILCCRKGISNELLRIAEGAAVIPFLEDRLQKKLALPGLIILDLNLIGMDGREVLHAVKSHEVLKPIPIAIYSTSANARDIDLCYRAGASSYSLKPVGFAKFEEFIGSLQSFWLNNAVLPNVLR